MAPHVRAATAAPSFASYGQTVTPEVVRRRVFAALEHQVLTPANPELRAYFERMVDAVTSIFAGGADADGVSGASDVDIEQAALLVCHLDADADGLLSPSEFAMIADLSAGQSGEGYAPENVQLVFREADLDASGYLDLNEMLLDRKSVV